MTALVLVHGAFHGAWCWWKLLPALQARRLRAITLDLPGAGADLTPHDRVTMASCVDRIYDAIAGETEPVIVVGHSLAGMMISAFAETHPERVQRLIYLAALIPQDGDSLISLVSSMRDPDDARPTHDPVLGISQPVPYDMVHERYYNDCSPEDAAFATERLRPQANGPRLETLHLSDDRLSRVPRSFIGCALDGAQSPFRQRITVSRSPCEHVLSLPTGHSPFISAPDALADMLTMLAKAPARGRAEAAGASP